MHEPAEGHLDRFQKKLKQLHTEEKKTDQKPKFKFRLVYRIAASVVVLFSISFLLFYLNGSQNQSLASEMGQELFDVQKYYSGSNEKKYNEIDILAGDDFEARNLKEKALRKVTKLEENTNELQQDYIEGNRDKRVFSAIVKNYKMLSSALDKVIDNMNKYNDKKSNK